MTGFWTHLLIYSVLDSNNVFPLQDKTGSQIPFCRISTNINFPHGTYKRGKVVRINQNLNPFNANPTKMVKHTQKIRWQKLTNCLSAFEHFVGFALKRLTFGSTATKEGRFDPFRAYVSIYVYIFHYYEAFAVKYWITFN